MAVSLHRHNTKIPVTKRENESSNTNKKIESGGIETTCCDRLFHT